MDFEKCYIQQNAPAIAENAIRRRLWFNIPFSATVCHAADHAAEWHHCNPVELFAAVWQILTAASSSMDGLHRFINGRRAIQISPAYPSAVAYAAGEWETAATLPELLQLIRQEVNT